MYFNIWATNKKEQCLPLPFENLSQSAHVAARGKILSRGGFESNRQGRLLYGGKRLVGKTRGKEFTHPTLYLLDYL
jgi:hypothetical protein